MTSAARVDDYATGTELQGSAALGPALLRLLGDLELLARWMKYMSPPSTTGDRAGNGSGNVGGGAKISTTDRPDHVNERHRDLGAAIAIDRRLRAVCANPEHARAGAVLVWLRDHAGAVVVRNLARAVGDAFGATAAGEARVKAEARLRARLLPRRANGKRATRAELLVEIREERARLLADRATASAELAAAVRLRLRRKRGETDQALAARRASHAWTVERLRTAAATVGAQVAAHVELLALREQALALTPTSIRARRVVIEADYRAALATRPAPGTTRTVTPEHARDEAHRALDRLEALCPLDEDECEEERRRLAPLANDDGIRQLGTTLLDTAVRAWLATPAR